ncbi:putative LPS assembly protein LptD [Mucilaginibacter ginkgonis]|uniref:LPS-assembly protein LptD n=1 Tax=Mucilaginibacter ginkgonis TaxID=2682091 RepID=A0A6I4I101_9SPHI|nr:putative LPS assembly protein LptD [Mucilaginibacter ginkgonis]QQL51173.1 LPS-assembly protein LptD [Mucilaginibacter ginkgonis]
MKFARFLSILLCLVLAKASFAVNHNAFQTKILADQSPNRDTLPKYLTPENKILPNAKPTKITKKNATVAKDTTRKASNGLEDIVTATSEDSSYTDNATKIQYLYGRARVKYQDFELDADFIRLDQTKKLIFASGLIDPKTHRYVGRPITKQKNEKPAAADSLYYNYETKKGKVWNPASAQDANFLSGGEAKRLNEDEVAYHNVIYSTCDLPYPDTHFGIVITKGIATQKQIISGPAYLEIEGVPLPLAIPFGFFPKPNTRASGVILPSFGEDARLGFYLRNFGYYLGFNDNIDLLTNATVYSHGGFELSEQSRYLKRYRYTGDVTLSFSSLNYGNPGDPRTNSFNIRWSHTQDPAAHPGSTFNASVNAGTSSYYANSRANTGYSLQQITQNNLRSSISYAKTWAGTPFNFTTSLSHAQDLTRKTIDLELPSFNFNMTSISPFDSKERVGEQKWYQKVSVSYTAQGTNRLSQIPESQLFQSGVLSRRLQTGLRQTLPANLNLTFLRFFQFGINATYNEYWNLQSINKFYDRNNLNSGNSIPTIDTIAGFKRAGEYNLGTSLSTKVYGTYNFKGSGKLRAIRHVLTPTLSFNYNPDYSRAWYNQTVVSQATVPYPYTFQRYSIFSNSAYAPGSAQRQAGVGITLDNTIEAKVRPKATDTSQVDKKIQILQGFTISSFYNFVADSFKLSPINFNGHTAVFNQRLNINFGGTLYPYKVLLRDSISNNQIGRYPIVKDQYAIPKLTNFFASANISFNSRAKTVANRGQGVNNAPLQGLTPEQAERLSLINQDQSAFVDFNVPWNVNVSYTFNYSLLNYLGTSVTNTMQLRGDVSITPKWKITYYSDVDIRKQTLSTAQFGIYRDLHCWDLSIQWIPFGYLKMYTATLRVKASILQDLKLSKRNDYTNNQFYNPYY